MKRSSTSVAQLAGAVSATLPAVLSPQLAKLVSEAPKAGEWDYEVKLDGYRLLARIEGHDVRLITRNANDWTAKLEHLVAAIRQLRLKSAWVDGEIVIADGNRSSFQALQNAFDGRRVADVQFYVFDLPYFDGFDLRHVALRERRDLLESTIKSHQSERIRFSETFGTDATALLEQACRLNWEGIIGKRVDSPYASRRSPNWIKLKCQREQEFVVVGFTDPQGGRSGFGSLMLAVNDAAGLTYAGSVGTGFDDRTLQTLSARLSKLKQTTSALAEVPRGLKGHWIKPILVAQVSFSEWTSDARIRHPVFRGLRTDKPPSEIKREVALPPGTRTDAPVTNRWRRKRQARDTT